MDDIAPFEAYFNKNIVTSLTTFGVTANLNNTFDSKQQLGQIIADDKINQKYYTWQFFYNKKEGVSKVIDAPFFYFQFLGWVYSQWNCINRGLKASPVWFLW